ncbi:MAG: hypothetical protein QW117_01875 [Candidatus Pacearchaeota archaeon]
MIREKNKKSKKAQLKIQQTAFMLVFLTIFFSMIGILFISFYMNSLKQNINILKENKAELLSRYLYQSTEFSCPYSTNCLDSDKLLFFNSTKYKNIFPVTYIKIKKVSEEKEILCKLSNYPNCNTFEFRFKNTKDIISQSTFVVLCRKELTEQGIYDYCELSRFYVGYEIK